MRPIGQESGLVPLGSRSSALRACQTDHQCSGFGRFANLTRNAPAESLQTAFLARHQTPNSERWQMAPRQKLHYLSLTTTPVQLVNDQDTDLGSATAFLYESDDGRLFLITNWHVVTGREPSNPSISKTGAVPSVLKLRLHKRQKAVGGQPTILVTDMDQIRIPINSTDGQEPRWLEHPKHRSRVDVVAIPIEENLDIGKRCHFNVLNRFPDLVSNYKPEAMDDVFVIGCPWGISATIGRGGGIPVYKRGSIASDPVIDYRRLPSLLIDCRTTTAMSGSPVIVSHSGIWMPEGRMTNDSIIGTVVSFLGVYSGRLTYNDNEEISEIGIVWKASVLKDILEDGVSGTSVEEMANMHNDE